jgi:hypothetical protein
MRKYLGAAAILSLSTLAQAQVAPDFLEMAKASAELNGISVVEAVRRVDLQGQIIDLQNRYLARFPNEFAGIVIEPTATSSPIASF